MKLESGAPIEQLSETFSYPDQLDPTLNLPENEPSLDSHHHSVKDVLMRTGRSNGTALDSQIPDYVEDDEVPGTQSKAEEFNFRDEPLPQDLLKLYKFQIGLNPLLDKEQVVDLSKRMEAGNYAGKLLATHKTDQDSELPVDQDTLDLIFQDGNRARDKIIVSNLKLVTSIARKFKRPERVSLSDVVQIGNIGLMKGVEKFDYRRGYELSTYVTWWILQEIQKGTPALSDSIHIPKDRRRVVRRAYAQAGDASQLSGEMAETFYQMNPLYLDAPKGDDSDLSLHDSIPAGGKSTADTAIEPMAFGQVLDVLDPRKRALLEYHYGVHDGIPKSTKDTGKKFGIPHDDVNRRIERIISIVQQNL